MRIAIPTIRRGSAHGVRRYLLPVLGAVLVAGACGEDGDDPLEPRLATCTGTGQLAVDTGLTPSLVWTPDCRAFRITVARHETGLPPQRVWEVQSDADSLRAGVRYGEAPAGTFTFIAAQPLERGRLYTATVYRRAPAQAQGEAFAAILFRP